VERLAIARRGVEVNSHDEHAYIMVGTMLDDLIAVVPAVGAAFKSNTRSGERTTGIRRLPTARERPFLGLCGRRWRQLERC